MNRFFHSFRNVGKRRPAPGRGNQGGFALLLTLFIVAALSAIVIELSRNTSTDLALAGNFQNNQRVYFLARSGVSYGMALLAMDETPGIDTLQDAWRQKGRSKFKAAEYGHFLVTVEDEEGKTNLNKTRESNLRMLFVETGVEPERAEVMAQSLMDWVDDNALHRPKGAEDDYYRTRTPPHRAKNGPIESFAELFSIRGFDRDVIEGKPAEKEGDPNYVGIENFVTIYGSGLVNVNTAPLMTLKSLPGMDAGKAAALVSTRERENAAPFTTLQDVLNVIGTFDLPEDLEEFQGQIGFSSSHFRIRAEGVLNDGREKRTIVAVVRRRGTKIFPIFWRDDA